MEDDDDPYGEADLAWDDAALQELESFEVNSLAQHRATQAPPPPPPRASQVPPQKPRTPAVQRPPAQHQQQQRRFPAPAPAPPRAAAGPPPTQSLPQPTQQPQYGHAKPSGILRPARPPPRPNAASTSSSASASNATAATKSAAGGGGGGGWKPRQSLNERGEPGFVDPNPFASASTRRAHPAVVDEDEDLPAIEVSEEGYRAEPQRGTTVSVPPPCAGAGREPGGGKVQPGRGGMLASERGSEEGQRAVVERGLDEAGKKEVEALRTEKEKLAQQLQLALDAQEKLKLEVMTKAGENSLVRQRLTKAEAAHTAAMRAEQRDKALLSEQLEAKEREYRAAFERMKMEDAFRRQELATAASASSAAGTSGSATSQRHYHHPHHAGLSSAKSQRFYARAQSAAPSAQASPSAGRAARAASQQPPAPAKKPPGPSFAGFQNAFGPSAAAPAGVAGKSARAKGKERERDEGQVEKRGAAADEPEGSMGPPVRGKREAPRTPAAGPRAKRRRGEEREDERDSGRASRSLLLVEEEGEEGDLGGHEHINVQDGTGGPDPVAEENDDDGEDAWVWVAEQHDTRSELLAAVFTHTTLVNIDLEPAAVPPTAHPHSHHRSPLAAAGSTLAGAGTARAGTARHGTLGATFGTRTSAAATHAPTPAAPSGPVPTFHALMNLRFPPSTPPALVAEHESIARELFTLLGRRFDPHSLSQPATSALASLPPSLALLTSSSPEELETALLAYGLARSFAALLAVLDAATLVGPMTALMRLIAHLTFIFPPFAHACCVVSTKPTPNATSSKPSTAGSAQSEVPLLSLLGRIIARYGRPEPPSKDPAGPSSSSSSLHGRTTPTTASGPGSRTLLRSRKARVARPSGGGRKRRVGEKDGGAAEEEEARVPLESGKRAKLLEALLAVLEGVGWRCLAVLGSQGGATADHAGAGDGGRAAEEAFLGLLKSPNAIATLLDPNHPIGTLLASTRVLAILACRPALFRTLLGTKFYEAPDVRASKLPLVDRIATLLVVPRTDSPSTHTLDQTLLTLSSLLLTSHEDAIMLVAQSATFVPELLAKMWRDVRTLWDWDGRDVGPHGLTREVLNRTTARLSSLLHVFYYLSLAPHSSLTIADLLAGPSSVSASIAADGTSVAPPAVKDAPAYQRQAVNDLFMAALGTVAFATLGADADEDGPGGGGGGGEGGEGPAEPQEESGMPSWAERGSKERRMLCELGYLAQEILEDVSPLELEEVEVCFGPIDLASGGGGGGDGGADGSGGEGDDDAMRDSGAGADEEEAQAQGEVDEEGEREARAALDREEEGEGASS